MSWRLAALIAAALLLGACDEGLEATGDFVAGVIVATQGKIDPNDPAKTLQNTLSGETIGNPSEDPAMRTTRKIAAQAALDEADAYAASLERATGVTPAQVNVGIGKYDRAIALIPNEEQYAQQRADALAARARFLTLSGDVLQGIGEDGDASNDFQAAGADFEDAARRDVRDPNRGNDLSDAARAYYDGGELAKACALAREAIASRTDDAHGLMAVRVRDLACR